MGSNDFGGKIVVFGNNICRNAKKEDHLGVSTQRVWHSSFGNVAIIS
jgi:ribosomal protein L28